MIVTSVQPKFHVRVNLQIFKNPYQTESWLSAIVAVLVVGVVRFLGFVDRLGVDDDDGDVDLKEVLVAFLRRGCWAR